MNEKVTIGVDAPRAWGIWSEAGCVAWHQQNGKVVDARRDAARALMRVVTERRLHVEAALVERPHGGRAIADRVQSLLSQSESAGWWLCFLEQQFRVSPRGEVAALWRSELGFPAEALDRDPAKDLAVALAGKAVAETTNTRLLGPNGGVMVDGSEAVCMSMVAWKWSFGITGSLRAWKETNNFRRT